MIVKLLDTTTESNPNFNFYYIVYDVLTLIPQYLRLYLYSLARLASLSQPPGTMAITNEVVNVELSECNTALKITEKLAFSGHLRA